MKGRTPVYIFNKPENRPKTQINRPMIYCVSDGRSGIERQSIALAKAIIETNGGTYKAIRINPSAPQVWLPPNLWPLPLSALPPVQREVFNNPPDIWIGNGRRSIAYSLYIKKHFPNTLVVQVQDPKLNPKRFDFIVAPKHDEVKGANVFETMGGLVYYTHDEINIAKAKFTKKDKKYAIVILGGNSKTHSFEKEDALRILNILENNDLEYLITTSRRTPELIANYFREYAKQKDFSFFQHEDFDGPNPYLSWLTNADYALITEDSANMIADAAFFNLPIHLLKLSGNSNKFDKLHNSFINSGAAKFYDKEIENFSYDMQDNVKNIANNIFNYWQKLAK